MKVSLQLFASLRELVGQRSLSLDLEDGATIDELKDNLARLYPGVETLLPRVVAAIDDEYVAPEEKLHEGACVSLIPPVSGGSDDGLFGITSDILDPDALVKAVRRDDAGAVTLFYGIVRNNSEGRSVERLEYEAYESMALKKMREVGDETLRAFPQISAVGVWHRTGTLEIGETSLLVAVSSPHRKEAFDACHWCVDRIKEVVPVWKKEHWAGGGAWVEGHAVEAPHPLKSNQ